jgi:isopentenyldiphosphate isomerase
VNRGSGPALMPDDIVAARQVGRRLQRGDRLTQQELDALAAEWEERIAPPEAERTEAFDVVRPDGAPTGVFGPRWLFHLFGLRHRAVEIGLATKQGLILLQKRSPEKREWPGALDMAVSGHVPHDSSFDEAAWKEMSEEIGLREADAPSALVEGKLTPLGDPYFCFEGGANRNPPFLDAEVRQVFAATVTGDGLSRLHFADNEVAGLLLVNVESAWDALTTQAVASGLRYSLPRYLDWIERNGAHGR